MNDIIFLVLFFGSIVFLLGCFILGLALEKETCNGDWHRVCYSHNFFLH